MQGTQHQLSSMMQHIVGAELEGVLAYVRSM
jgi:hypothetical protein